MEYVFITLLYNKNLQIDLCLPCDVPNQLIARSIAQALNLYKPDIVWGLSVVKEKCRPLKLPPSLTLTQAKVLYGESMVLTGESPPAYLMNPKGLKFVLDAPVSIIGRGKGVNIDLTELDDTQKPEIGRAHV